MAGKLDYKKEYKDLYLPKTKPSIVEVPSMQFIMIEGTGDPNTENGEYSRALELLYPLSYTIKMAPKKGISPEGYFEYVVPPLEGLWWIDGFIFEGKPVENKAEFKWISMIRQPEFVTQDFFAWAQEQVALKNPSLDPSSARLVSFEEGLCAQILHLGPYDDEPGSIATLDAFIKESGYVPEISDQAEAFPVQKRHHEIYLGDPRKSAPEKLKTVLRHPIRKA
ncbi:MAG: GyrI-like domain-containing protein [Raoultibacter sp.]|jgi:hypothetical protein